MGKDFGWEFALVLVVAFIAGFTLCVILSM